MFKNSLANKYLVNIAVLLLLLSCNSRKHEVELALKTYDRFIQNRDVDSIAGMYRQDGFFGFKARGRDSIRRYLSNFSKEKISFYSSTSDRIYMEKDTAVQTGHYRKDILINSKEFITTKGTYSATWIWSKEEGWKLHSMMTRPADQ